VAQAKPAWHKVAVIAPLAVVVAALALFSLRSPAVPTTTSRVAPSAAPSEPLRPGVVFFGDSYTRSVGASAESRGYPQVTARLMGWPSRALGLGGTGFTNPGPAGLGRVTYIHRLAEIPASHPAIVVVQTSGNDGGYPAARVKTDADAFFGALAKQSGKSVSVVVMGPIYSPNYASLPALRLLAQQEASAHGWKYIDPNGWITPTTASQWIGPDKAHPTDAGHAHIAAELAGALKAEGFKPIP
jgi:lysophospholipase L1-like esterase